MMIVPKSNTLQIVETSTAKQMGSTWHTEYLNFHSPIVFILMVAASATSPFPHPAPPLFKHSFECAAQKLTLLHSLQRAWCACVTRRVIRIRCARLSGTCVTPNVCLRTRGVLNSLSCAVWCKLLGGLLVMCGWRTAVALLAHGAREGVSKLHDQSAKVGEVPSPCCTTLLAGALQRLCPRRVG